MASHAPPSGRKTEAPPPPAPESPAWSAFWRTWTRVRERLRREPVAIRFDAREAARAASLYLAVSAIGFAVLLVVNHKLGNGTVALLRHWDSNAYLTIAERGYPGEIPYFADGSPGGSRLAFFPLVPGLIRGVHLLTGLPFAYAGVVVSWVAGAVAAAGVHTLVRSLAGSRAGYACVALWACSPYACALWVPYSEAVFSALLFWTLLAVLARRWVVAGLLCALAGMVRPTASVLIGTVVLAAGWAVWQRRANRHSMFANGGWRPWAAVALAPLGLLVSWLYIGHRVGRIDGWFEAERAWGQSFDFGRGTYAFLREVASYRAFDVRHPVVLALILLTAVALVALVLDRGVPWPLVIAALGAWVLMVSTPGSPFSKPRFMLPFLPVMLLLVARPLARAPVLTRYGLYAAGAVVAGWYGVGLLMVFKQAP
ncbi:hypothetical protein P8605_26100 [Streptomyces sp. T-3]|nr:hypothetical protein [Streptomyces sp. T-3]